MIKINLLPQRRVKRAAASEDSAQSLVIGVIALAAAAAAVVVFVDRPRRARLAELREANAQTQADIEAKSRRLIGHTDLKKAVADAEGRYQSIQRLMGARVTPAYVLHELGEILTASRNPTMTDEMKKRTGNGSDSDPDRQFQPDWDPSSVWLTGFTDTGGDFKLEGGAANESDITQLAKRLAVSVYFDDVTPAGFERAADEQSGSSYYKFTITGKVVY